MCSQYVIVVNSISGGGAENSMLSLAIKLNESNYRVSLCTLNRSSTRIDLPKTLEIISFERNWKDGFLRTYNALRSFQRVIKRFSHATFILNCELPELYMAFSNWNDGKVIVVEHTTNPWFKRKFLGMIVRIVLRVRKVTWVTVLTEQKSIWNGPRDPVQIPNMVHSKHINHVSDLVQTDLVFVGRIREEKRPEWVIKAAIANDLKVHLFGDGDLKADLEAKYEFKNSLVAFHGFVENVWEGINPSALLVVPSRFEGDGLVIIEGILRGFQLLLSDNPDLRRFGLPDKNYFRDYDELNHKVQSWAFNGKIGLQVSDDIRASLGRNRDPDSILNKWEMLFEEIHKSKLKGA